MIKNIKKYRFTLISSLIVFILFAMTKVLNFDLFEKVLIFLKRIENYEADELLMYSFLLLFGIITDLLRVKASTNRTIEIQNQRLQTMQATMVTVQDIVGNALNGLQILRLRSKAGNGFSKEDLKEFDRLIYDTADKINRLRNTDSVTFKKVADDIIALDVKKE